VKQISLSAGIFSFLAQCLVANSASSLDGGTLRLNTFNGWKAFEVISQGEDPSGDGFAHSMPSTFDGAGAWLVDASTLRVQVNHEIMDTSISEVNIDLADLQSAISNMMSNGNTGGVSFVISARQAYDRWSDDGGSSWTDTSSTANTSFNRFCSGQAYAANTFGIDRGFVDEIYITGEEFATDRLFAIDSANRDFYLLSGTAGSAPGGVGGIPFDSFENVALLDTGETSHVALLLSPDGGTSTMRMYIGEKGKDSSGSASSSFLARNGLAYGSWYYLIASYPSIGNTNSGAFAQSSSGALSSDKLEDVDTSPSDPTQAVLGDQTSGVFVFDFEFVFGAGFEAGTSSFSITMISTTSGGSNSLNSPDNVDWTDATTLGATPYPNGLIFVNEDNSSGEIWLMKPDGTDKVRIASTNISGESTGIFDLSEMVGYRPGSIMMTNNQGSPASMSVLINPDATLLPAVCGDGVVQPGAGEECDDGGTVGGDGCSTTCQNETIVPTFSESETLILMLLLGGIGSIALFRNRERPTHSRFQG
jgi:cysteine-rich repeat protein